MVHAHYGGLAKNRASQKDDDVDDDLKVIGT